MARRTRLNPNLTLADGVAAFPRRDTRKLIASEPTPTAVLQPFKSALARRNSGLCKIAVFGDSSEEGQGALPTTFDGRQYAWPERLGRLLRDKYPTDGLANWAHPNWTSPQLTSTVATGWTNGGWQATSYLGPDAKPFRSTSEGNTLTFTTPIGVTAMDVVYTGGSGNTGFTVSIDGGAASATVLQTGQVRDGYKYPIDGLSPASAHTITLTSVGTISGPVGGHILHYGSRDKGIQVYNFGRAGSKTSDYLAGGAFSNNPGWLPNDPVTSTTLCGPQAWRAFSPDLIIMAHGYNDMRWMTSDSFKANQIRLINAFRTFVAPKTVPVIFLTKWAPGASWAADKPTFMPNYSQVVTAMGEVAAAVPNALALDLSARIPFAQGDLSNTYGLHADIVHGSNAGYQMIADDVFSVLAS
ncbi:SGNH/GDSL hydrolase family protein [Rhodococcoides fascians]|uniref:SGNH/GDSL hydrolase family protein n=1 Tax=Rhodococcoides fascians TaxID=1828 RepID=UPI0037BA2E62